MANARRKGPLVPKPRGQKLLIVRVAGVLILGAIGSILVFKPITSELGLPTSTLDLRLTAERAPRSPEPTNQQPPESPPTPLPSQASTASEAPASAPIASSGLGA